MPLSTFEAKYSSRCPECPTRIEVGDEVVYVDDTVVHVQCGDAAEETVKQAAEAEVCQKCWQTRSVTGACGCDPED